MKIAIVSPASSGPRSGNRHTAARWAKFLREAGHRVAVATGWDSGSEDVLIALHARKSYDSIGRFHAARPGAPLIVVLTGTDLYRDIRSDRNARRALDLASQLVVLQERGLRELSRRHRAKTRVIYQSADVRSRHAPPAHRFRVAVIGHLRNEKDPFRATQALARLPQDREFEIIHLGAALTPEMRRSAQSWMKREPRYRWLGSKPHGETMRWLARSHVLVVSSVMEGGANVICEAARIGVPVLASRVRGNIGMLGSGYAGYFRLHDHEALAGLLERAARDSKYYRRLKDTVRARRRLFAPAAEGSGVRSLVRQLDRRAERFRSRRD
ncbi:MAG TPA: selenoneine biosynthesis selenosugar synthase SenB [Burkholderiales bacterium]|jgi:putative glycosyltransferase (TIGR04348 family)